MIEILDRWDQQLMVWLNYDGTPWADAFWYAFSYKWTWVAAGLAVLAALTLRFRHNWRRLLLAVVAVALVVAVCDQISSHLIKPLVMRPRPSHQPLIQDLLHYVNGYRGGRYGFVSSHAANSFGVCVLLMQIFRGRIFRTTLLLWTLANCYSRIYLGVHYPGDILGGTVVGIAAGYAVALLYRRLAYAPAVRRHDTELSREEDLGYASEPWTVTATVWLTVLFLALFAAL